MFADSTINNNGLTNITADKSYENQSRSAFRNVKHIDANDNTPWNKREKDVHALGIALLVLGILAAAATVALALCLTATPIVIIAAVTVAGVAATALTISGICLLAKSQFWDDPAYRQKQKENIIKDIKESNLSYPQVQNKYRTEIQKHKLLSNEDYDDMYAQDISKMEYPAFKRRHGEELIAKLSDANQHKLLNSYLQHLEQKDEWSYGSVTASPEWRLLVKTNAQHLKPLLLNHARRMGYGEFRNRHGGNVLNILSPEMVQILAPKYFQQLAQSPWSFQTVRRSPEWPLFVEGNKQQLHSLLHNDAQKLSYAAFINHHGKEVLNTLNEDVVQILAPKYFQELGQEAWSYSHVRQSPEWSLFVASNDKQLSSMLHNDALSLSYDAFIKRHGVKVLDSLSPATITVLAPKYLESVKQKNDWNYRQLITSSEWQLFRPTNEQFHQVVMAKLPGLSFQELSRMGLLEYLQTAKLAPTPAAEIKSLVQPKFLAYIATLDKGVMDILGNFKSTMETLDVPAAKIAELSLKRQIEALRSGAITYQQFRDANSIEGLRLFLDIDRSLEADFRTAYLKMGHLEMAHPRFQEDRTLLGISIEGILEAITADAAEMGYFAYKAKHGLAALQNEFLILDSNSATYKCSVTWRHELIDYLKDKPAEVVFRHDEDLKIFGESALKLLEQRWSTTPISQIMQSADKAAYIKHGLSTPEAQAETASRLLQEADQKGWQVKQLLNFPELWQTNVLTPQTTFADGRTIQERLEEEIRLMPQLSQLVEQYQKADDYKMLSSATPPVRKLVLDLYKKHALKALPVEDEKLLAKFPYFVPEQLPEIVRTGKEKLQEIHARSEKAKWHTKAASEQLKDKLKDEFSQAASSLGSRLNTYRQEKQQLEQQCETLQRKLAIGKENLKPIQAELQALRLAPTNVESLRIKLEQLKAHDAQLIRRGALEMQQYELECRQLEAQLRQLQQSAEVHVPVGIHSAQLDQQQQRSIAAQLEAVKSQYKQLELQLYALRPPVVTGLRAAVQALPAEQEYHRSQGVIMQQMQKAQNLQRQLEAQLQTYSRAVHAEVLSARQATDSRRAAIAQRLSEVQKQQKQLSRMLEASSSKLRSCTTAYEVALREASQAERSLVVLERKLAQENFILEHIEHEAEATRQRLSLAKQQLAQQEAEVERAIAQRQHSLELALINAEHTFQLDINRIIAETEKAEAELINSFVANCNTLY